MSGTWGVAQACQYLCCFVAHLLWRWQVAVEVSVNVLLRLHLVVKGVLALVDAFQRILHPRKLVAVDIGMAGQFAHGLLGVLGGLRHA